jgi:hypothetical protein
MMGQQLETVEDVNYDSSETDCICRSGLADPIPALPLRVVQPRLGNLR